MEKHNNNPHLAVVFDDILPAIKKAGFRYWVYGGVGVAAVVGKFIRENDDVDIYVLDLDFQSIKAALDTLCRSRVSWGIKEHSPLRRTGRPKFDIVINGTELLSVVPVYKTEEAVEFRVNKADLLPTDLALTQESKEIGGYRFFSPPKDIIKIILRSLITERPYLLIEDPKRRSDAKAVFTQEEFSELEHLYELYKNQHK
jgi:hypothetical protein